LPQNSGNGKQELKRAHHGPAACIFVFPSLFSVRRFPEISFPNPAKKLATGRHLSPNKPRMLNLPNAITLTPGTITVDVKDDVLWVHALTAEMAEGLKDWHVARQLARIEEVR